MGVLSSGPGQLGGSSLVYTCMAEAGRFIECFFPAARVPRLAALALPGGVTATFVFDEGIDRLPVIRRPS